MRSSYIFWIDRGTLFGRIIFNENANNNAYRAVPQDVPTLLLAKRQVHDHCEKKTRIFTHSGTYNIIFLHLISFKI